MSRTSLRFAKNFLREEFSERRSRWGMIHFHLEMDYSTIAIIQRSAPSYARFPGVAPLTTLL